MAKQLPGQTQHLAKSLPGMFRFGESHPDWIVANVFGVDDERGHHAVKRCKLLWVGRSEGHAE